MKYRENVRHELDRRAKVIIILGIVVSFLVIMVPLWQKGSAATISMKMMKAEERLDRLEKEERVLLSSLSTVEDNAIREEVALAMADFSLKKGDKDSRFI